MCIYIQIGNPEGEDKPNKKFYDPRSWIRKSEEAAGVWVYVCVCFLCLYILARARGRGHVACRRLYVMSDLTR